MDTENKAAIADLTTLVVALGEEVASLMILTEGQVSRHSLPTLRARRDRILKMLEQVRQSEKDSSDQA